MKTLDKVVYTARTHTTGGRDGQAQSDDGKLKVELSSFAGTGAGTNPEQMFAAGYSACFMGALRAVAGKAQVTLSPGEAPWWCSGWRQQRPGKAVARSQNPRVLTRWAAGSLAHF